MLPLLTIALIAVINIKKELSSQNNEDTELVRMITLLMLISTVVMLI